MTFDSRQLSFIIISIAIHPRHHHHHHHHFSCLLPPAFFQATLSSSVFIHVRVPYHLLKQNKFFNFSVPLLEQSFNLCSILLFNVLGTLPGQLFLDTLLDTCLSEPCLGTCSWEPCLGTCSWEPILRNLLLGALPDYLFLGTFSWEPVLGNFACFLQTCSLGPCSGTCFSNFAWEPCLGTCPLEPCLGFCSCFQPCLQLFFDIL